MTRAQFTKRMESLMREMEVLGIDYSYEGTSWVSDDPDDFALMSKAAAQPCRLYIPLLDCRGTNVSNSRCYVFWLTESKSKRNPEAIFRYFSRTSFTPTMHSENAELIPIILRQLLPTLKHEQDTMKEVLD